MTLLRHTATAAAMARWPQWSKSASWSSLSSIRRATTTATTATRALTTATDWNTINAGKNNNKTMQRGFQSKADFEDWRIQVQESAFRPTQTTTLEASEQANDTTAASPTTTTLMEPLDLPSAAPFLQSVSPMADQLLLAGVAHTPTLGSPRASLLECTYPLATNELLRYSVSDFSHWSAFRLGKFYELVDALTADVAYRHVLLEQVTLVTAGHYHSRKYARTDLHKDVALRSYITKVGRSSLEVRTDGWQEDRLVNVCHTIMVALDPQTLQPLSKVGKSLPPLVLETDDDRHRLELANQHEQIRKDRSQTAMQLRQKVSAPPTFDEMQALHKLHRQRVLSREQPATTDKNCSSQCLPTVQDYTFRSSRVIFPEQRNVHGKLFGGFVMAEAQSLAQYTATFFGQGVGPIVPMGIDEAIFLQPVGLGDLVTFTARLVHATATTCRVNVTVEVRDPKAPSKLPQRSNRLLFVFGGDFVQRSGIIPETYQEILMHMDARRRHQVEGPWEEQVQQIISMKDSSTS